MFDFQIDPVDSENQENPNFEWQFTPMIYANVVFSISIVAPDFAHERYELARWNTDRILRKIN